MHFYVLFPRFHKVALSCVLDTGSFMSNAPQAKQHQTMEGIKATNKQKRLNRNSLFCNEHAKNIHANHWKWSYTLRKSAYFMDELEFRAIQKYLHLVQSLSEPFNNSHNIQLCRFIFALSLLSNCSHCCSWLRFHCCYICCWFCLLRCAFIYNSRRNSKYIVFPHSIRLSVQ